MEKKNFNEIIRELRKKKGYSQKQIADKLYISASAYGKVERSATLLDVPRLYRITEILGVSLIDVINYKNTGEMKEQTTKLPAELEQLKDKLEEYEHVNQRLNEGIAAYKQNILGVLYSAYSKASFKYDEPKPFEDLDEMDWKYLEICGIKTKVEYEAIEILIGHTTPEKEAKAFDDMLEDIDIYKIFEQGMVDDSMFLTLWNEFKLKGKPKFKVDGKNISRIGYEPSF